MQAIFDSKVQFSTEEWKGLVEDAMEEATDSTSIESESLKCLARVPNLLKRARASNRESSLIVQPAARV
jgi:hypothetical protein